MLKVNNVDTKPIIFLQNELSSLFRTTIHYNITLNEFLWKCSRVYFQDAIYFRIPLSLNLTNIAVSIKHILIFCCVKVYSLYFRPFMHLGILQQQNIYDIIKSHVFYSTNWLNYCVLLTLIRKEKTLLEKDLSFSHLWIQAKISFKGFGKKIRWSDIQP